MKPQECPILLISGEASTQRREPALASLEKLGFNNYQWVKAVDGRAMTKEGLAQYYNPADTKNLRNPMSRMEVGCYLSHLQCHRIICEQDLPYALVMEDDIRPTENLLKVLECIPQFPKDWGLVNLGPSLMDKILAANGVNHYHRQPLFDDHYIGKYFYKAYHTHLYLITSAYAQKLQKHLLPIRIPIDHAMFDIAYSLDYPYIVYRKFGNQALAPNTHYVGSSSEIEPNTSGTAPKFARSSRIKHRKYKVLGSRFLGKNCEQLIKTISHIGLNLPWSADKKVNFLHNHAPDSPRHHRHLMLIRSVQWHKFPLLGWQWLRTKQR